MSRRLHPEHYAIAAIVALSWLALAYRLLGPGVWDIVGRGW